MKTFIDIDYTAIEKRILDLIALEHPHLEGAYIPFYRPSFPSTILGKNFLTKRQLLDDLTPKPPGLFVGQIRAIPRQSP